MKSTQAFFSLFFLLFLASSVALSGTNSPYDKCARGVGVHANLGKKAKQQQSIDQLKGKPRLPHFAIPRHYNLFLKPNLTTCGFAGEVQITVDVVDYTRFLVLNSVDLAIQNNAVWFKAQDSKVKLRPAEVVLEKEDEILVLRFDEYLPTGSGILSIRFTGALNDDMKGFYRSVYEYEGEKRNMAVTQFQPADARRCFPCWDEPAFKAKFKMTLEVPSELVALSNMPVAEEKINGPVKTLCFQESPLMSTYLVAVVVGMLDYVEGSLPRGLKVRVYCPVGKASQGKLALDVAVKALEFYEKYFDVPYSLPKLDMVAIADFDHGAMENYGLVTFREKYLLYDENKSTASTKQWVVIVAAHELAHQWFGNLVTMEWWSHLWLNEGFATWMSYLVGDIIFPEWKLWTQFLEQTSIALGSDALAESHPIQADINYVNETEQRFDSISYQKAASVIRMVHNYLGADSFQRSLVSYIKRFAHSNAKTEDLLAALEVGSGEPVISLMNSWTKQKGFPVVSVELDGNSLKFEQSQFLASGSSTDAKWIIPVTLVCGSYDTREKFFLESEYETVDLLKLLKNKKDSIKFWIKVNVDQVGPYRVKYDDELFLQLRYAIEASQLSDADRFAILDDSFALCMAGRQTVSSLIKLIAAYEKELDPTVLTRMLTMIGSLHSIIAEARPDLVNETRQVLIDLLQFSAKRLGWESRDDESHLDAMVRAPLLGALIDLGHKITIDEAVRRFNAFMNDRSTPLLPPDIRKAAYAAVMKTVDASNRSGFESLLRLYRETDASEEKALVLGSLASGSDPSAVLGALNFVLSSEVRKQDLIFVPKGITRKGRDVAWKWLKDNWDHITKTWGAGSVLPRFIKGIVPLFASDESAKEIEEFFASRTLPSFSAAMKQNLETVRNSAKWARNIKCDESLGDTLQELAHSKNQCKVNDNH